MTQCHVCHKPALTVVDTGKRSPCLVSSDARPVKGTVDYAYCAACGTLQKLVDARWRRLSDAVYEAYDINYQKEGSEPMVFGSRFGDGPRSQILLRFFLDNATLGEEGRLLDVGCADGKLLGSFHAVRPRWRLYGSEISDRWRAAVLDVPGVERFYVGREIDYFERYDVISLSHVLEHVPDPSAFLRRLSGHLNPGGRIMIAVPDLRQNPIDLVIADHCTHFDVNTLAGAVHDAGLTIDTLASDGLPKELVAIARLGTGAGRPPRRLLRDSPATLCKKYLALLAALADAAREVRNGAGKFGLMGSSIAAAWLAGELDSGVDFFVDEDKDRIGGRLLGLPILGMGDVPAGATVFIPLSLPVAEKIIARGRDYPIRFVHPDWHRLEPDRRPGDALMTLSD